MIHNYLSAIQNAGRARIASVALPYTKDAIGLASVLQRTGFIHAYTRGNTQGPNPAAFLQASKPEQRLWLDIKYGNDDRPITQYLRQVSKGSRRVFMSAKDVLAICTGRRAKQMPALNVGEIAIFRVDPTTVSDPIATDSTIQDAAALSDEANNSKHNKHFRPSINPDLITSKKNRKREEWLEAREALGRGLGGEFVARVA